MRAVRLLPREAITLVVSATLAASGLVVASSPRAAGAEAAEYLEKMVSAENATYRARRLVVYFGSPQSAAVLDVHAKGGETFVRAEAGTDVTRVWREPGHGLLATDTGSFEDASPPSVPLRADDVLAKYDVGVGEASMMLGRRVVPLELVRRMDDIRVERLWVDQETGVVYRRELFGRGGDLVGISTVLDMQWGDPGHAESYDGPAATKVVASARSGVPERLPYGYRLVQGYALMADGRHADHWVYSDGFHTLSVFRAEGTTRMPDRFARIDVAGREVWAGPGPGTFTWEGDSATWVLVAEEPQLEPAALLEPFPSGGPTMWARLGSWWARAWHWVAGLFS